MPQEKITRDGAKSGLFSSDTKESPGSGKCNCDAGRDGALKISGGKGEARESLVVSMAGKALGNLGANSMDRDARQATGVKKFALARVYRPNNATAGKVENYGFLGPPARNFHRK